MTFIFWDNQGMSVAPMHDELMHGTMCVDICTWKHDDHELEIKGHRNKFYPPFDARSTIFSKTVPPGTCVIIDDNSNLFRNL